MHLFFLDCSFHNDIDDNLPLYPPPELPPRSSSPTVHSRVSNWLSEMPSTSRVRSAPTHNAKSMCCNTGIIETFFFLTYLTVNLYLIVTTNSTKPTTTLHDKDLNAVGVVNTVGAAAAPFTASPSHSPSPENVIYKNNYQLTNLNTHFNFSWLKSVQGKKIFFQIQ